MDCFFVKVGGIHRNRVFYFQKLKTIFTELIHINIVAKTLFRASAGCLRFWKVPTEFFEFQNKPNLAILTNEYCALEYDHNM